MPTPISSAFLRNERANLANPAPTITPPQAIVPPANPSGLTSQQINAGYSTIPGNFSAVTGKPIPTSAIGTQPLTIPTVAPTMPVTPTVAPPSGTATDASGNAAPPPVDTKSEESPYQKILASISKAGETLASKGAVNAKLQEQEQLAKKTEQAAQDYNIYQKAKLEQEQTIEKMRTSNPSGQFAGALEQNIANYTARSNANLANLAVVAQASQGLESAARQTIKDKLEAQFQPITDQIDFLTQFAQLNQDDLTASEKMKLSEMADQKRFDQSNVQKVANDLHQAILDNGGDPGALAAMDKVTQDFLAGKINAQQAQDAYYNAAGQYGVSAQSGFNLSAGQTRFDANGNIVASLPAAGSGVPGSGPGGSYATDLDAIVGSVLSTIPTKFGQQTFQGQMAKARNDADKINLVAAQVLKGQPAEYKNDFRNQAVGISEIDKAIAELDTGVATGYFNNAAQYTANFFGKDYDPKLAKINGYITAAIQPYRNSVTGAAWGDQEDGEYQQLFGSTKYSPDELKQRLLQTKELLKTKSAEGLNAFVNPLGYYDNPFASGALAPGESSTASNGDEAVFDEITSQSSGYWSGLWDSILGK